MPGIDYQALRSAISMAQVLEYLKFQPTSRHGPQLRGPCPIHDPLGEDDRRCLSIHLARGCFYCFRCHAKGNQLDLWQQTHRLPLYQAALDLCRRAQLPPPRLFIDSKPLVDSRNQPPYTARKTTD